MGNFSAWLAATAGPLSPAAAATGVAAGKLSDSAGVEVAAAAAVGVGDGVGVGGSGVGVGLGLGVEVGGAGVGVAVGSDVAVGVGVLNCTSRTRVRAGCLSSFSSLPPHMLQARTGRTKMSPSKYLKRNLFIRRKVNRLRAAGPPLLT
jgi:hypothetical protein